ncbi:MAG: nitrite/sulfite reductase [Planctomycetota bacterium]|nr:nitrite/sulfite reductase [Planctomycetota bacterium]MCX8039904.1 nitrite/sulfite reductase [Planctomycetota bacterium]MDW8373486.1 nitrite/sulfite reductase [Planctomycetota bacterium]
MSTSVLPEVVERELAKYASTIAALHAGAIDPDKEFKPFRLVHGVYGQRQGGFNQMVRIKLAYGKVTPQQLRVLAAASERFTNGIVHITTRQAVQLHFVQLDDTPALLRMVEEAGLTTREACGNAIRNVVASPNAGTLVDEPFAIEPYAEAIFRHFLRGPRSSTLPRKFKIGMSGSDRDPLQQVNIQDIGITALVRDGQPGFRIVAGGGLGSLPVAPCLVAPFVPREDLIPWCEAIVRVHHKHGDRQNRARARLKFVLKARGEDGFRALIAEELAGVRAEGIAGRVLPDALPPPQPTPIPPAEGEEGRWRRHNCRPHREAGLAVVSVCVPRGDLSAAQLRALADLAEQLSAGDVRTTNDQNLLLRRVPIGKLEAVYRALGELDLARPAHVFTDVVSCPGASTCQLGITLSKNLARELEQRLAACGIDPLCIGGRINISGCPNSCGQHHIGTIGLHGAAAKIGDRLVPHYLLLVGGADEGARVHHAIPICRIPARKVVEVIGELARWYLAERRGPDESFSAWLRRQAGADLDKDAAKRAREAFKARIEPLCAIRPEALQESDLRDIGAERLFSLDELGTGECMS